MALELRFFVVRLYLLWKQRYNYVLFFFVIVKYFLLRHNYVIYFIDVVTFSYDVRITLYFGMFELRMKVTLQLHFVFVRRCDVFFLTSLIYLFDVVAFLTTLELRFILVSSNYVGK